MEITEPQVILLSGGICAGKDTLAQRILKDEDRVHIVISDIVKKITSSSERTQDASLDTQIKKELKWILTGHIESGRKVLVNGIRQCSIYDYICEWLKSEGISYRVLWLEVLFEERKQRFLKRRDPKDTLTFEYYEVRDLDLGVGELRTHLIAQEIKKKNNVEIIENGDSYWQQIKTIPNGVVRFIDHEDPSTIQISKCLANVGYGELSAFYVIEEDPDHYNFSVKTEEEIRSTFGLNISEYI